RLRLDLPNLDGPERVGRRGRAGAAPAPGDDDWSAVRDVASDAGLNQAAVRLAALWTRLPAVPDSEAEHADSVRPRVERRRSGDPASVPPRRAGREHGCGRPADAESGRAATDTSWHKC